MAREGEKTITVSSEKHKEAKKIAKKLDVTLKKYIEDLIGIIPPGYNSFFHIPKLEVSIIE